MRETLNWRRPFTLTLILDLDCSREKSKIVASIREFETQLKASTHPVKKLIHFLRIFLLSNGAQAKEQIVFSVVFDGEKIDFVNFLIAGLRTAFLGVVENVAGGGELGALKSDTDLVKWVLSHDCNPSTYHVGTVWNSLAEIHNDRKLFVEISAFFDQHSDLHQFDPQNIKRLVEQMIAVRMPNVALHPDKKRTLLVLRCLDAVLFRLVILLIPTIPAIFFVLLMGWSWISLAWLIPIVTIAILLGFAGFIRYGEIAEEDLELWPDDSHVRRIVSTENVGGQNQITLIADIKDSFFRRSIIVIALWIADAVSRHWYRRGVLAGIDTIHFARFFLINDNTQMLFLSDYDGSWGRYLFDFTGVGSLAVVPIWSSLKGCPKAKFLRWPEVGFEERFLPFTRLCQIETQCWFSSYPRLTVSEIKRNEMIRSGLFKQASDREILDWLALFGGAASV